MSTPTPEDLRNLEALCDLLRDEARVNREVASTLLNIDARAQLLAMSRACQDQSNSLLTVLRHFGVPGLPGPLALDP